MYATGRRHYMRRPALLIGSDKNLHTLSTIESRSNSVSIPASRLLLLSALSCEMILAGTLLYNYGLQ